MFICHGRKETEETIQIVYDWAKKNDMQVNKDKSQIIQFRKNKRVKAYISKINDLKIVNKYKYLGIYIDEALTMEDMYEQLAKKFDHFTKYIFRLKLNKISLKMRYNLF